MAKEISLSNNYNSVNEFKATVKSALLSIPEGMIRIHTWYDNSEGGNIPYTNVVLQQKVGAICIGGVDINGMDYHAVNINMKNIIREAIEELKASGIHVYPRIKETWQA